MLSYYLTCLVSLLPSVFPIVLILYFTATWATLCHIPGPFFSAFTNIPRFFWVRSRRAHEIHIALHEHYGPLVRMGPNMVSVADPAEIGHIYGFSGLFKKVHFPATDQVFCPIHQREKTSFYICL